MANKATLGSGVPVEPETSGSHHDPSQFLRTDHLNGDLTQHSVRGGFNTLIGQATQFLTALGSFMILARLLTPSDFGLIAMVSVLLNLVEKFKSMGLATAVVREPEITHMQISVLFWLNLKRNGFLALSMVALAPVAAWFYSQPNLTPIILVVTVGVFASGLSKLHWSLLQRQMRFGIISAMEVVSLAAGATTAIVMAMNGAGYWALVLQQLVMLLTQSAILWGACGWRPATRAETRAQPDINVESMLTYGRYTTFAGVLSHVAKEIDRILIGRIAGAAQLGLYQAAQRWSTLPIQSIYIPLNTVTLAGSSRLHEDPDRYRQYAKNAFLCVFTGSLPGLAFLYVNTHDVVLFLLGPRWLEVIPLFRILALAAVADCANRLTGWIYQSEGQMKRRYTWTLISAPFTIAGIAVGAPWGAMGVATGYAVTTAVLTVPSMWYCLKTSRLRGGDLWAAIWRPVFAAFGAAAFLALLQATLPSPAYWLGRFLLHGIIFVLFFSALWVFPPGGVRQLRVILEEIKSITKSRRQFAGG